MDYGKKSIELHEKFHGKLESKCKVPLENAGDLALAYTPGVGAVSSAIGQDKELSWQLTNRANSVAVVSDGTAVLGLGNIGPEAGMPVMEGKACLFKRFAGVDAVPLCIDTQIVEEIINFCKQIQPSFGGINLEDISAPRCFEILNRLEKELDIPVFHDDQDGTAIVVLAGLINACRATNKDIKKIKVVINGSGAAGIATTRLLLAYGVEDIILIDSIGALYQGREEMNDFKKEIAAQTNQQKLVSRLEDILPDRDVFIGVSKAKLVSPEMIKKMKADPIIFALANPIPEILPNEAIAAGAAVVGTGRSDFPNQINNALVFPGMFRGLLDARIKNVTTEIKLAAAQALADVVNKPDNQNILPKIMDKSAPEAIAKIIQGFKG